MSGEAKEGGVTLYCAIVAICSNQDMWWQMSESLEKATVIPLKLCMSENPILMARSLGNCVVKKSTAESQSGEAWGPGWGWQYRKFGQQEWGRLEEDPWGPGMDRGRGGSERKAIALTRGQCTQL